MKQKDHTLPATWLRQSMARSMARHCKTGTSDRAYARHADSYAISVDTLGKLRWSDRDLDGDHLICVVSERAPQDDLGMLRETNISITKERTEPNE